MPSQFRQVRLRANYGIEHLSQRGQNGVVAAQLHDHARQMVGNFAYPHMAAAGWGLRPLVNEGSGSSQRCARSDSATRLLTVHHHEGLGLRPAVQPESTRLWQHASGADLRKVFVPMSTVEATSRSPLQAWIGFDTQSSTNSEGAFNAFLAQVNALSRDNLGTDRFTGQARTPHTSDPRDGSTENKIFLRDQARLLPVPSRCKGLTLRGHQQHPATSSGPFSLRNVMGRSHNHWSQIQFGIGTRQGQPGQPQANRPAEPLSRPYTWVHRRPTRGEH